jgi:hypothetical protein
MIKDYCHLKSILITVDIESLILMNDCSKVRLVGPKVEMTVGKSVLELEMQQDD